MKLKLYGIRVEKLNSLEENAVIQLLDLSTFDKYELFVNQKKLRKVKGFISPTFLTVEKVFLNIDEHALEESFKSSTFITDILDYKEFLLDTQIGEIFINSEYFKKVNLRQLEKRPVWIFYGASCLGKSYLASFATEFKTFYETDICKNLPKVLTEDIIVIGNKYKFSIDDIKAKYVEDVKFIEVDFKES